MTASKAIAAAVPAPAAPAETVDMRDTLGYLIGKVRQEMIDVLDRELAPLDLTAAQYIVIVALASDRAESPKDLCRSLQYDTGAMTRLLDRVESKGLIGRLADGGDRRCVRLELTAAGRELYPKLLKIIFELNNRARGCLTKAEADTLEKLLKKL